jgi:hypothetical protein
VQKASHDRVVHHGQAGHAADDQVRGRGFEQLGEDRLHLGQAVQAAVVARVGAVGSLVVTGSEHGRELIGQVELLVRRLAARHVELQRLLLDGSVARFALAEICDDFLGICGC